MRLNFWPVLFYLLLLSTWSRAAFAAEAGSAPALVEKANAHYQQADYLNAAKEYRQAIREGADGGHVYYNLANTYVRLEQYGHAIAAYREALLDLPSDPDVLANLELARKETKDRIVDDPQLLNSISKKLLAYYPRLPAAEMQMVFLTLYSIGWIAFLGTSVFQLSRARSFSYICFTLALIWSALTFGVGPGREGSPRILVGGALSETPAVVTAPETKLYSGDSASYQVVFVLHEGAEVLTRERRSNWIEVLLPDGRRGWAKTDDVEVIA